MVARRRVAKGFTLVEILIVVVILGILAAIVIPQFTSASETARQSSLESQLQTIRSQLELYQVQHNGNYPTLPQMATFLNLVESTDINGATTGTDFGPYLQKPPANPFTAGTDGTVVGGSASATTGWVYNQTTGGITSSLSAAQFADFALDVGDVTTY